MTTPSGLGSKLPATRLPSLPEPVGQGLAGVAGRRLLAIAGAVLLGGCAAVGPDFKRPEIPWLRGWSGGSLDSLNAEQRGKPRAQTEEWWRNFNDPVLVRLIAEAPPAELLTGAMPYAAGRIGQDPKYTKHATTWLHAESWANEPAATPIADTIEDGNPTAAPPPNRPPSGNPHEARLMARLAALAAKGSQQ